jgi:hypothetical protein
MLIKRAWPVWGTPLTIYLALLTPYLFKYFGEPYWNADFHLRFSGFTLQILFVAIVVIDIVGLLNDFDRPGFIQSIKKWFKDLYIVFVPQKHHVKIDDMGVGMDMTTSGVHPSLGQKDLELEERVEIIEQRLQDYMDEVNQKMQELRADLNEQRKDLKKEIQERELDLKKFKGFVERISTKGLKREGVALVWLIAGLAFSIFPTELSYILNWL